MAYLVSGISFGVTMKGTIKNAINSDNYAPFANSFAFAPETTMTSGVGANQFDRIWYAEDRVVNSGASENLDLYDLASFDIGAGAGKDALGIAMTNAELVALAFWLKASSTGATLLIGGEGSGAAFQSLFHVSGTLDDTAGTLIKAGGCVSWFCPTNPAYVITDSSNHLLKIAASGANATYDCCFFARSA